ncbi:MAG: hypothetical protein ABL916_24205 [Burkholderiaceae bacterium]
MNAPTLQPGTGAYAIQLLAADPSDPARLAGRLEHVLSGRRHDFDNGAALLACLAHEQQQVARAALPAGPVTAA